MSTIGLDEIYHLARQESAALHHYFVGVEHLFVALTQLDGGLTVAVLEHHGISPRFIRYSIRETIGKYEDRRYWPGFQETPRTEAVLKLAQRYAGSRTPSERDFLLAILDEGQSIAVRVLQQAGVDTMALRETAANWTAPLEPQLPDVPIEGDQIELSPDQRRVLQLMFRDYGRVQIVRELAGGYSGARVLLVRPIRVDGNREALVVVKLHDRYSVLYERRRYDVHVKGILPANAARLVDSPVVPDDSVVGGLKYNFVGLLEENGPVSLREFAMQRDPQGLSQFIRGLFDVFGPAWWLQHKPYHFNVWREYEHVLPPALVVEALPEGHVGSTGRVLKPLGTWSRDNHVKAGEIVALDGLVVQKLNFADDVLYLSAGAQAEAINRASKVEVRGMGLDKSSPLYRGAVVERIVGRVVLTREDLLLRSVYDLEPDFNVFSAEIPSQHDMVGDLPNPLMYVRYLLDRQVTGRISTIHGDLHLGNILVGPYDEAWLIDFAWTRDGHTLFDWAMLEASLLVEIVSRLAPPGWEGAWGTIALLDSINRGEQRVFEERHHVARALTVVATIRDTIRQCLGTPERWDEYHIALSLLALRLMEWKSETIDARRLAFLVSALSLAEVQSPSLAGNGPMTDVTTDLEQTELRIDD